jgi:glycosyltransferase involved in cell wall biosynthesis
MLVGRYASFSRVSPRESVDGLEVIHPRYLLIPKVGMTVHGWMMYRSVLSAVSEVRRNFDFDLVDAHFVYPDGFAAARLARHFGRPLVVSARGSDINQFRAFPLIRRQIQSTLAEAAGIIAVSSALRDSMVELGTPRDRIAVIPNGVDSGRFHPIPKEEARATLGLPPGPMVLCVGHLNANKGFHLVVDAVASLAAEGGMKELHLAIVGDGPFRAELERTIRARGATDRVRLVGHTSHDALRLWYGAADVFCLASEMEGMPNAVLEALACGVPVVATAAGGIPEIITSTEIGILSERNGSALASALGTALGRSWDRAKIAAVARERTWDRTAAVVRRVFEKVLARRQT